MFLFNQSDNDILRILNNTLLTEQLSAGQLCSSHLAPTRSMSSRVVVLKSGEIRFLFCLFQEAEQHWEGLIVARGHGFDGVLWANGLCVASGVVTGTSEECVSNV
jgi:hypothetical protein